MPPKPAGHGRRALFSLRDRARRGRPTAREAYATAARRPGPAGGRGPPYRNATAL